MWDAGLVAEVEHPLDRGLAQGRTARTALGYAQAIDQLRGALTQTEAIEATAAASRRFARRQESWFRPDSRITCCRPRHPTCSGAPRRPSKRRARRRRCLRMADMSGLAFTKGHGTENDFVLVADPDGRLDLRPEQVRALADRRAGIGADGVIRVVPTHLADDPDVRRC